MSFILILNLKELGYIKLRMLFSEMCDDYFRGNFRVGVDWGLVIFFWKIKRCENENYEYYGRNIGK